MSKQTYKISKKAYQIDRSQIKEGYLYSPIYCYADSRNEARYKLLAECFCQDAVDYNGQDFTYTTVPVIRYPELDYLDFEGESKTMEQIQDKIDYLQTKIIN